jgi:hypothetical protein
VGPEDGNSKFIRNVNIESHHWLCYYSKTCSNMNLIGWMLKPDLD